MTVPEQSGRRPSGDFGTTGTFSRFKGPYAGGPPQRDLKVDVPPIGAFGIREITSELTATGGRLFRING